MIQIFYIFSIFLLSQNSWALKANYVVRSSPNGGRINLTSGLNAKLTGRLNGKWAQITYLAANGSQKKAWVHRNAVTKSDFSFNQPASVKDNFNLRQGPRKRRSNIVGLSGKTPYFVTGKRKKNWHQVGYMKNGRLEKAWVHQNGLTNNPRQFNTASPKPQNIKSPIQSAKKTPVHTVAMASSLATPFRQETDALCDFAGDPVMEKNCNILMDKVNQGALPRKATVYSLKVFKSTYGKYCDGDKLQNKLRNGCSFFFADLDSKYKKRSYQSPAYLIDLCAGDSSRTHLKDLVNASYTNRGKRSGAGRKRARYTDIGGRGTTLAGVFRTGALTAFHPGFGARNRGRYKRRLGYRRSDSRCKGKGNYRNKYLASCPVLRLDLQRVGGARTDSSKPMHTSPYSSSAGCPSVGKQNNWIMRHLASKGSSLYIAHTKRNKYSEVYQKPRRVCKKDFNRDGPALRALAGGISGVQ